MCAHRVSRLRDWTVSRHTLSLFPDIVCRVISSRLLFSKNSCQTQSLCTKFMHCRTQVHARRLHIVRLWCWCHRPTTANLRPMTSHTSTTRQPRHTTFRRVVRSGGGVMCLVCGRRLAVVMPLTFLLITISIPSPSLFHPTL